MSDCVRLKAPAFSRCERSSPFGKRTEDTRTKLSTETKAGLARLWRELGYQTESEFLAELIEGRVHGVDELITLHAARVIAVAGRAKK